MGLRLTTVITELLIQTHSQPCVCSEGAPGETRKTLDIGAQRGDGWPVSPAEGEGENENRGCRVYSALEKLVWVRNGLPLKTYIRLYLCRQLQRKHHELICTKSSWAGFVLVLFFPLHQSVHCCIQPGQPHHPSRKQTKISLKSHRLEHQSATASARSFTQYYLWFLDIKTLQLILICDGITPWMQRPTHQQDLHAMTV